MENIEYMTWEEQLYYWEEKRKNAQLENDYWTLKIQRLKDGDEIVD